MLWLKYTKSGRSWTRVHWIDVPVRKLSRIGSRNGLFAKICEWQFMQVFVGGTPAKAESSTEVWQYLQSMPLPPTWRSWLNWIGCSRATRACVTHGDRFTSANNPRRLATKKTAPKMLTRAIVLALR